MGSWLIILGVFVISFIAGMLLVIIGRLVSNRKKIKSKHYTWAQNASKLKADEKYLHLDDEPEKRSYKEWR